MKKLNFQNTITALILVCLFICSFIVVAFNTSAVAYAVDVSDAISYTYDTTDVMKDLEGSEGFNVKDYPINKDGNLQILTFLEYGYSKTWNHYGLYLYIYNPQQKSLSRSSASNKANVAIAYDEKDEASSYRRFNLVFCSASDDRLFYKYRIDDSEHILLELAQAYAEKHDGTRRYDVSNAELLEYGSTTASATVIGKSYECTGFMKGFGDDKTVNTFDCKAYSIDVLDIELKHTFFRPEGVAFENYAQSAKDQLDSVYFSFPNKLIEYYGGIWKIATSYYSYHTKPIYVTSVKEVYDDLKNYVGKKSLDGSCKSWMFFLPSIMGYKFTDSLAEKSGYSYDEIASFSERLINRNDSSAYSWLKNSPLYYLFYTGNETADGSVPYAKDFTLSCERLLDYIYKYDKSFNMGTLDIKDNISKDLFFAESEKFTSIEVYANDTYNLEGFVREKNWYDFLDIFGLFPKYRSEKYENISAIVPVEKSDISLEKNEFCKKYLISETAYDDIIRKAKSNTETVYLFRFAQSSYISAEIGSVDPDENTFDENYNYCAMETVYLDMNISSITCKKGDVYHTFAVCSNPIDIVADIEHPVSFDRYGWWKDLISRIKNWFDENKGKLTVSAIAVAIVIICVVIVVLVIKLMPTINANAQRRAIKAQTKSANAPPTSKPKRQRQRRQKPKTKTQNKKTTQRHYRVGRRKAK